jgi:hypothetical protein
MGTKLRAGPLMAKRFSGRTVGFGTPSASLKCRFRSGGPTRIRTENQGIMSPLL